jgi:hypothetical protein
MVAGARQSRVRIVTRDQRALGSHAPPEKGADEVAEQTRVWRQAGRHPVMWWMGKQTILIGVNTIGGETRQYRCKFLLWKQRKEKLLPICDTKKFSRAQ